MPIDYSIDPAARLVTIRYRDPYTFEEWSATARATVADPRFQPGYGFLVDRRHAQTPTTDFERAVAQFIASHSQQLGRARVSLVVSSDVAYGMARMQEVFNETAGLATRAFTSFDEALEWLSGTATERG